MHKKKYGKYTLFLLLLLFVLAFYNTAWIAEDAFITFRVIDNWLNGFGLRWNIDERVQVYTHPLWLLILTPIIWITKDPYWSAQILNLICLISFIFLYFLATGGIKLFSVIGVSTLIFSKAFIEYSSSGLENPLTHVLLTTFFIIYFYQKKEKILLLCLTTSLLYLNRPDSIIIITPAFIYSLYEYLLEYRKNLRHIIIKTTIGFIPVILWLIFSIIYYGSLVPNTAIAKVKNGLTYTDTLWQFINLTSFTFKNDKVTIITISIGFIVGLTYRKTRILALGIPLWALYLSYIGGDYMAGRFFTGPLVISTIIIGYTLTHTVAALIWSLFLISQFDILHSTVLSTIDYKNFQVDDNGIADERGFYYSNLGLRPVLLKSSWTSHSFFAQGFKIKENNSKYQIRCNIGMTPYAAGHNFIFIDPLALSDSFLARIPARSGNRVGHYERALPEGYIASRVMNTNQITDPAFRKLWHDVKLTTQGELFTSQRFNSIYNLIFKNEIYKSKTFNKEETSFHKEKNIKNTIFTCLGQESWGGWSIDAGMVKIQK